MRHIFGLVLAFFILTGGIIVLFQSVDLVAQDGMTMLAGAVLILSFFMMIASIFLVWMTFRARRKLFLQDM